MKIKDVLAQSYQLFLAETQREPNMMGSFFLIESMMDDRTITLGELDYLFRYNGDKEIAATHIQFICDSLARRWERIRSGPWSYPHARNHPLTQICEKLVDELVSAGLVTTYKYKILMPTVSTFNELTGLALTNQNDKMLLSEFVLSDDDKYFIEVETCLYYAKEDLKLKQTHALPAGKAKELSKEEVDRVINHSIESQLYYREIKELYEVKNSAENMGASVKRLIKKLREGGLNGGRDGTDAIAGQDARAGIREFYVYLCGLTDEEKEMLFSCSSTDNQVGSTLQVCWYHLLISAAIVYESVELPDEEIQEILEYISTRFTNYSVRCVELIAGDLSRILNNHPELFNLYPVNKGVSGKMLAEIYENNVQTAQTQLINAQKSENYQVRSNYGEDGNNRFIKKMLNDSITSIDLLRDKLSKMPIPRHISFLRDILGVEKFRSLVTSAEEVRTLLRRTHVEHYASVINLLGAAFFREKVTDVRAMNCMANAVASSFYETFFKNILGNEHCQNILKEEDTKLLFTNLSHLESHKLASVLGVRPPHEPRLSNQMNGVTFFGTRRRHKRCRHPKSEASDEKRAKMG
jgi:hypothetical protein